MEVKDKFDMFRSKTEEDITSIIGLLQTPELSKLYNWLLTTDINPYSFLPEGFTNSLATSSGTASLFYMIHHATIDDGEISFVTVNDEPRMLFIDVRYMSQQDLRKHATTEQEKMSRFDIDIEILKIQPNDFGDHVDFYQRKCLQKWFIQDAAQHGIEFAEQNYSKYKLFSAEWKHQLKDKIDKTRKYYNWGNK